MATTSTGSTLQNAVSDPKARIWAHVKDGMIYDHDGSGTAYRVELVCGERRTTLGEFPKDKADELADWFGREGNLRAEVVAPLMQGRRPANPFPLVALELILGRNAYNNCCESAGDSKKSVSDFIGTRRESTVWGTAIDQHFRTPAGSG